MLFSKAYSLNAPILELYLRSSSAKLKLKVTLITLNEGCNFRELSTKHETRTDNFKVVIDN